MKDMAMAIACWRYPSKELASAKSKILQEGEFRKTVLIKRLNNKRDKCPPWMLP